jgi:hypothetical protein
VNGATETVTLRRMPHDGIQPEVVVDSRDTVHLVYFSGQPGGGDIFYIRSTDFGATFSAPVRVNSQAGSAIATGTIRGAQLAVGRQGHVHVVWNGSNLARPQGVASPGTGRPGSPMLYALSNAEGTAFEPQRNLMTRTTNLDGGGSLAADLEGRVYVVWHGNSTDGPGGEEARRVWLARSTDDGVTFGPEVPISPETTGACGCCGMRMIAGGAGAMHVLYRSAARLVNRDVHALSSSDYGRTFRDTRVHEWNISACPMTSMSLTAAGNRILGAWETNGQVFFADVGSGASAAGAPFAPIPGTGQRKHPRLAVNRRGDVLLLWTEGMAWARGGSLAWQVFGRTGKPVGAAGAAAGVPVWSFGAVAARPDGSFVVFY